MLSINLKRPMCENGYVKYKNSSCERIFKIDYNNI